MSSTDMSNYKLAKSILGADFITPKEVTEVHPNIVYTDKQLSTLVESLPSENVLKWCKENNNAVTPAPPTAMSTLDIREMKLTHFYKEMAGGWYTDQAFALRDKTSFGWLAIKKTPLPESVCKSWNEQKKLLAAFEKVPNAAEMSWFITTYFEIHDIRLFEQIFVRTSSFDSRGQHVLIGCFNAGGLHIYDWPDTCKYSPIGLPASRKL